MREDLAEKGDAEGQERQGEQAIQDLAPEEVLLELRGVVQPLRRAPLREVGVQTRRPDGECDEGNVGEHECLHVPLEQLPKAAALGLDQPVPAPPEAARLELWLVLLLVGLRGHLLVVAAHEARLHGLARIGQQAERNPDQHAAAEVVHQAGEELLVAAGAVALDAREKGVLSRGEAHEILHGTLGHRRKGIQELCSLEQKNEVHKLELVWRTRDNDHR
mmetsp:Transcript_100843/g.274193  ORF Transcript_100843/g.274193 Transcript_100843/m.274193 type:complete len:219 (+) Transcript_100843:413-1069(+)